VVYVVLAFRTAYGATLARATLRMLPVLTAYYVLVLAIAVALALAVVFGRA